MDQVTTRDISPTGKQELATKGGTRQHNDVNVYNDMSHLRRARVSVRGRQHAGGKRCFDSPREREGLWCWPWLGPVVSHALEVALGNRRPRIAHTAPFPRQQLPLADGQGRLVALRLEAHFHCGIQFGVVVGGLHRRRGTRSLDEVLRHGLGGINAGAGGRPEAARGRSLGRVSFPIFPVFLANRLACLMSGGISGHLRAHDGIREILRTGGGCPALLGACLPADRGVDGGVEVG